MWRPIATAPRGVRVVVYVPKQTGYQPSGVFVACRLYDTRRWVAAGGGLSLPDPTHWQPCPETPEEDA